MSKKNALFFHLRLNTEHKGISIAANIDRENSTMGIDYFSFENKDQYSKRLGRAIAKERAKKSPLFTMTFTDIDNPYRSFIKLALAITNNVSSISNLREMGTGKKVSANFVVNNTGLQLQNITIYDKKTKEINEVDRLNVIQPLLESLS